MYTHKTVFLKQAVDYFSALGLKKTDKSEGLLFLDATLGGGGHTREILETIPNCKVVAVDWDHKAVDNAISNFGEQFQDRLVIIHANFTDFKGIEDKFRFLTNWLDNSQPLVFDGILADFGTSQNQILNDHGFSFSSETPLDMRMSKSFNKLQARDIVSKASEQELFHIFSTYGEEPFSKIIAKTIVFERQKKHITTTKQLAEMVFRIVSNKTSRHYFKTHPATRVFQALRIAVNDELKNIELFLKQAAKKLVPGGNLVCISFHSLEDRIVKNVFKELSLKDDVENQEFKVLTKKPLESTDFEIKENKSCRSAKLRVLEKSTF